MRLDTKYKPQAKALGIVDLKPEDTLEDACAMLAMALNWPVYEVSEIQQIDSETAAYYLFQTVQDMRAQGFRGDAPRVLQKNVPEGEGWPEPSPAPLPELTPPDLHEEDGEDLDEEDGEDDNPLA